MRKWTQGKTQYNSGWAKCHELARYYIGLKQRNMGVHNAYYLSVPKSQRFKRWGQYTRIMRQIRRHTINLIREKNMSDFIRTAKRILSYSEVQRVAPKGVRHPPKTRENRRVTKYDRVST